jgi:hypothetical protein
MIRNTLTYPGSNETKADAWVDEIKLYGHGPENCDSIEI